MIIKKYLQVDGMSCKSCESKILKLLQEIPGINSCKADYVSGIVEIKFDSSICDSESVISIIKADAGYSCKGVSSTKKTIKNIYPTVLGALIIFILYRVSEKTGVLNNIPQIDDSMSYSILFIVGIMTSIHCIGMCGGINLSQTSSKSGEINKKNILKRGIKYNLGRLISYTTLGGIVGAIGSVFSISLTLQGIIIIIAGLFMIIMGLNMIGLFSFLKNIVPVMPESISSKIQRFSKNKSPFLIGILNGFMPCGPLQSMQLYALSSGSFINGAFSMFLFSAGTIPLMLGFGTIGALFSGKSQKNILKISALLILVLGWGMINRGLSLNGISFNNQSDIEIETNAAIAKIEGDRQIVISSVTSRGYEPIIVQVGIPVLWTLKAGDGDLNGCNNTIIVREFRIREKLNNGDTLVEFTPQDPGNYPFSCWMGMISSNILVVEDLKSFDPDLLNSSVKTSQERVEIIIPEYFREDIVYSKIENGTQYSELRISSFGFKNSIIIMQKNIQTEWTFIPSDIDDKTSSLFFPIYNAQLDLNDGKNESVDLVPDIDIYFYTWLGDFLGFVILVDDIKNVNEDEILDRVRSYLE